MKNAIALGVLLAGVVVGCAAENTLPEREGSTENHLNASAGALWPKGEVPVCWGSSLTTKDWYPNGAIGPSAGSLAEKKKWVQQIAQTQWGARTPIHFVGWKDCDAVNAGEDSGTMVHIVPIDSLGQHCDVSGQPCAEALGTHGRGKRLFLNLSFGDEFLYLSRLAAIAQTGTDVSTQQLAARPEGGLYWLPTACLDELRDAWFPGATGKDLQRDINDPAVLADAKAIIESCTKANVLHELGHVAGFAHEQYRTDDKAERARCVAVMKQRNLPDDLALVPAASRGDLPLGTFDSESIMSYCRLDKTATLTTEDVAMATRVYGASQEGQAGTDGHAGTDGQDGASIGGGVGGKGGKGGKSE